jgi:hypothetical protein
MKKLQTILEITVAVLEIIGMILIIRREVKK